MIALISLGAPAAESDAKENVDKCDKALTGGTSVSKPSGSMSAEDFAKQLAKEERLIALLTSTVKFALYDQEDQIKIARYLLKAGKFAQLSVVVSATKDPVKAAVLQILAVESPRFAVQPLMMDDDMDREKKVKWLKHAIAHSTFGELAAIHSSSLHRTRRSVIKNSSKLVKAIAFVTKATAFVFPAAKRNLSRSLLEKTKGLTDVDQAELFRLSLQHDPLSVILGQTAADITAETPLRVAGGEPDLSQTIERFAATFPQYFPAAWTSIVLEKVDTREVALGLIRELYRLSGPSGPWAQVGNSLELIGRSAGLDYTLMSGIEYTREAKNALYETVLQMQTALTGPALAGVTIEPAVLRHKRLTDFNELLTQLKYLLFLRGNDEETWRKIETQFALRANGITSDTIQPLITAVRGEVTIAFAEVLKAGGGDVDSGLTFEQFRSLETTWLDTDTIFTLIARYNSNRGWRPEIAVLAKMLRAEVDGRFIDFKRNGNPADPLDQEKAKAQTAVLKTPSQQAAWWQQWTEASVFEPQSLPKVDAASDASASLAKIKKDVVTAVTPLLESTPASPTDATLFQTLLASKSQIPATLKQLGVQEPSHSPRIAAIVLKNFRDLPLTPAESQKALAYLKYELRQISIGSDQISDSIPAMNSVNEALRELKVISDKNRADKREIVITVTSTSLRTSLGLAAMVQAGSCMDPSAGLRADAIPSIAIDANIQAIFSTSLTVGDFSSVADFQKVIEGIASAYPPSITFNGNRDTYRFTFADATTVGTSPVTVFYRRHQLKLAVDKRDRPVIRTERAFTQYHEAAKVMAQQTQRLKERMAKAMGGSADVDGQTAATRNLPGGAYSDTVHTQTGNGAKTDGYFMPKVSFGAK